jgi:hypothetical protein
MLKQRIDRPDRRTSGMECFTFKRQAGAPCCRSTFSRQRRLRTGSSPWFSTLKQQVLGHLLTFVNGSYLESEICLLVLHRSSPSIPAGHPQSGRPLKEPKAPCERSSRPRACWRCWLIPLDRHISVPFSRNCGNMRCLRPRWKRTLSLPSLPIRSRHP